MKKLIVTCALYFFLVSSASAFAPLAIAAYIVGTELAPWALTSAAIHVAGAVAGLYYYFSNGNSSVSSLGEISRSAKVTYVDLSSMSVKEKSVTAKIPASQVIASAKSKQSTYPQLATASRTQSNAAVSGSSVNGTSDATTLPSGSLITGPSDGLLYRTTSLPRWNQHCSLSYYNPMPDSLNDSSMLIVYVDSDGFWQQYIIDITPASPPTPVYVDSTPNQFAKKLAQNGVSGPVKSLYQAEIDKMYDESSYVGTFTDDTTGLPYAPPSSSSVATPAQVDVYNKSGIAKESADTAKSSAGNAVSNAGNAYTASGGNIATGVGGDSALYQKYLEDKLSADKLQAKLDIAASEKAVSDSIKSPGAPATAYGDGTTSDFGARFGTFVTTMKSSGLFALPGQVLGNIPLGGSSVFNISFGRFGSSTLDLASFGSAIAIIRSLVLMAFSIYGFKIITLKGGSG